MNARAHLPKYGKNKIRLTIGERLFDFLNVALFILIAIAIIFPFFNIFAISLTSNAEYMREPFIIFPKEPTLEAYSYMFGTPTIPRAYAVTLLITSRRW